MSALRWADVDDAGQRRRGVLVTVRRGKTNQEGETRDVRLVKGGVARAISGGSLSVSSDVPIFTEPGGVGGVRRGVFSRGRSPAAARRRGRRGRRRRRPSRISERTREGLAKARASGRKLGRPKGSLGVSRLDGKEDEMRHFLDLGVSKTAIAKIDHRRLPHHPLQLHDHQRAQAEPLACITTRMLSVPLIRRPLGHIQVQERPQAQRIGHPPCNPALRRQALEVADQQYPEIPPRTQTRPAHPRRVEHRAQTLDEGVETRLLQDPVQTLEEKDAPRSSANPLSSPTAATPVAPPVSYPLPWVFSVRVRSRRDQAGPRLSPRAVMPQLEKLYKSKN